MQKTKNLWEQELENIKNLKQYENIRKPYWNYKSTEYITLNLTEKMYRDATSIINNQDEKQQETSALHIIKLRNEIKLGLTHPAIAVEEDEITIVDGNHRLIAYFLEGKRKYYGLKVIM